jgi:anti-sigma-K factor RskA
MIGSWHYMMEDRGLRQQDFARMVAERESYARSKHESSLRARIARRLFDLAVAAEREETWRLVWERLEARGRL